MFGRPDHKIALRDPNDRFMLGSDGMVHSWGVVGADIIGACVQQKD
jgi:hypothetical protein